MDRQIHANIHGAKTMDAQFAERRAIWLSALGMTPKLDENSIVSQLATMMWDTTAFKLIASARLLAAKPRRGEVELSLVLHNLLDRCFFNNQMVTIRRLASESCGLEPGKGKGEDKSTWSLNQVLKDMAKHGTLFTRDNILGSYMTHQGSNEDLELWNTTIDRLCGVESAHRSGTDVVLPEWFHQVQYRLSEASDNIKLHVDKFIAHAAAPSSRSQCDLSVLVEHLWRAQETVCRCADFALNTLLTGVPCLWIAPGEDWTRHMDKPLIPTEVLVDMNKSARSTERQCEAWSDGSLQWFSTGITQERRRVG
jgi:hypothetical protein